MANTIVPRTPLGLVDELMGEARRVFCGPHIGLRIAENVTPM